MDYKLVGGAPAPTTFGVPGIEGVVDATFGAQRSILKPDEYNASGLSFNGGHYRVARSVAGVTGVAAAGGLVSFRWATTPGMVMLKRVAVGAIITTVFTTAQAVDFDLVIVRNFTAADTGGTGVTPITTGNQRVQTRFMNSTQVNDFRETSAGALTPGTGTADASAEGIGAIQQTNVIGSGFGMLDLYKHDEMNQHPIMLQNNEGFRIRTVTAMGAAGVIRLYYVVEWAEVPGV